MLTSISPFFIVDDLVDTIAFYQSKLGFTVLYKGGGDADGEDYFAMMGRDNVTIMLKAVALEIHPQPNHLRHTWARWDAYVNASDPDTLHAEFLKNGVVMHQELADTSDGLRAFEIVDNNGYVVCFGRPKP